MCHDACQSTALGCTSLARTLFHRRPSAFPPRFRVSAVKETVPSSETRLLDTSTVRPHRHRRWHHRRRVRHRHRQQQLASHHQRHLPGLRHQGQRSTGGPPPTVSSRRSCETVVGRIVAASSACASPNHRPGRQSSSHARPETSDQLATASICSVGMAASGTSMRKVSSPAYSTRNRHWLLPAYGPVERRRRLRPGPTGVSACE